MSGRRMTLVAVGLVLAFVAPMSTAYALWVSNAGATIDVKVQRVFWLENPGTGNTSSSTHLDLVTTSPTLGSLPNYDTDRDSSPGLYLAKGSGLGESDTSKQQRWAFPGNGTLNLKGPVKLRLWSAMKDSNTSKRGSVVAGLYQCDNNTGFTGCSLIAQATVAPSGAWSGGSSGWVRKEWNFGTLDHSVPHDKRLYLKLVVNSSSDDDMWFAYDTAAHPSALLIG